MNDSRDVEVKPKLWLQHRHGRDQPKSARVREQPGGYVIGCARAGFLPDLVLARDDKILSRRAAVVRGCPGEWQMEVLNGAGAGVEFPDGTSLHVTAGRRVAINNEDRFRFPGDAADSDSGAHWLLAIVDPGMPADAPLRDAASTTVPLRLGGGVTLELTEVWTTTVTALCARYLVTTRDGRRRAATTDEIRQMLERVTNRGGGAVASRQVIDDRLRQVRIRIMEKTGVWIDQNSASGESVNQQIAKFLSARGAMATLNSELAEVMLRES